MAWDWFKDGDGNEFEKRSSVSLHCRNGTTFGWGQLLGTPRGTIHVGVAYLAGTAHVTLHLQALPKIHQTLVDLPCLGKSRTCGLGIASSFTASEVNNC